MEISFLTEQEKTTDRRSSKALTVQTANGRVTTDTQAKVYIRELCAVLWVFFFENSPSVLSSGRSCSELGSSFSWPSGGISQSIQREGKRVIQCSIENFVRMVTVIKQRVVPSGVFCGATGDCELRTEMENPLVKPVSEGAGEDASFSKPTASGVTAVRDVEHKKCMRSDSALVGN